jgi:hypothetical protein
MYAAILTLTLSATPGQCNAPPATACSAQASCASTARMRLMPMRRASACSAAVVVQPAPVVVVPAAPACSGVAVASCSGRVGLLQRHHQRMADRHQAAADRIATRRGTGLIVVQPAPVTPEVVAPPVGEKKKEKLPPPKK